MKNKLIIHINEYLIDIIAIVFVIITVIISINLNVTLSSLAGTNYEPIFIIMCASTSITFFSNAGWKMPGFLILLIAAFSVNKFNTTHNIIALLFFICSYIEIFRSKRYAYFSLFIIPIIIILIGSIIYNLFNLYILNIDHVIPLVWTESIAILSILSYHVKYLYDKIKVIVGRTN